MAKNEIIRVWDLCKSCLQDQKLQGADDLNCDFFLYFKNLEHKMSKIIKHIEVNHTLKSEVRILFRIVFKIL